MSSSFVPKIKMSKGTAKKNRFDVSCNTHTTSEVGYLQPTFSKMVLPNCDLKVKVQDSVLMSSLVCPTFGDLALRHWVMATPVSSLWSCLGAFLTQRSYNDLDSQAGHSIPKQMPRFNQGGLLRYLSLAPILRGASSGHVQTMYTPAELMGNLTYAFKATADGYRRSKDLMSFDELEDLILKDFYNLQTYNTDPWYGIQALSSRTFFKISGDGNNNTILKTLSEEDAGAYDIDRYSPMFPWWWTGVVVKNTDDLRKKFIGTGDLGTTFPKPDDAPFVVVFVNDLNALWYDRATYDNASGVTSFTGTKSGGLSVVPLTNRMFAGDTDPVLYREGWRNDIVYYSDNLGDPYLEHPTGNSFGWMLQSDDTYFTGDLNENPFDVVAIQSGVEASQQPTLNHGFFACVRLSRRFKRIRKVFIGLGSQFNPFDSSFQTPWKIMSYYKGWFDNFYPKRDIQYYQTPLARLVNYFSYHSTTHVDGFLSVLLQYDSGVVDPLPEFYDFIDLVYAIGDAKYLMPVDYFSLADKHPLEYSNTSDENMDVVVDVDQRGSVVPLPTQQDVVKSGEVNGFDYNNDYNSGTLNGWAVKMADKMLSYLTKKRVVGKSVSESMRAIFGAVDEHDKAHESTWCLGTHSSPIKIRAVQSQAETSEMHLGDLAGQGIGGSTSETFSVSNKSDIIIVYVMSTLVPRLSYFQGINKENLIGVSPNDFCKPLWDAVGYDDVDVVEYIADATDKSDIRNTSTVPAARSMADFNGKIIGLVPRYTWYKTARDIVNADMSLPSLRASMNPYVLTRNVPVSFGLDPYEMRTINPDDFNKIFNESSSLDDHFILQIGFDVKLYAPLKSVSTSFDDFDESEDGTIEVEHS